MTTKKLNIIDNDTDIAPLKADSINMINKVFSTIEDLKNTAYLLETIHGHIIHFSMNEDSYFDWQKGKTKRLSTEELTFFISLTGFRWVEYRMDELIIGFTNTP